MKKTKKAVAGILTVAIALSAFAFTGCSSEEIKENVNKVTNGVIDMFEESGATTETTDKPSVEDYDGTIVQDGESYAMMSAMAFTASTQAQTTETETFTPVSCELVATVEPSDANQNVYWTVEFVDPTDEWTTGKAIGDYIEVTEKSVSTGNVICYKPFGAQIKITATSEEKPDISASCTVDFVKSIKSVSLVYGDDLPINLGGITDVIWEVNPNGVGMGGDRNMTVECYNDYTIDREFSFEVEFVTPAVYFDNSYTSTTVWGGGMFQTPTYKDGYFVLNGTDCGLLSSAYEIGNEMPFWDITSFSMDYKGFVLDFVPRTSSSSANGLNLGRTDSMSINDLINNYLCKIDNGYLYTVKVVFRDSADMGTYTPIYTYYSLLNLVGYTNIAQVQSITLGSEGLQF